jgi:murein L,D-transpeptidase YcbB/YkuD
MRRCHFDRLLATTAVAVALGVAGLSQHALAQGKPDSEPSIQIMTPEPAAKVAPAAKTTVEPKTGAADEPAKAASPEPKPAAAATPAEPPKPVVAAAPAPTPASTADTQVADKLRDLANGKYDRLLGKKERASIETFYAARNFAPLWLDNGAPNARAKAAIAYLAHVDADGLDPADYSVPAFKDGLDPDALADAELRFTQTVLTYAHHALRGRIHFSRVSADIDYQLPAVDPADVLGKLAGSSNVADTLDSFEPQQPGYKALKAKLAETKSAKPNAETRVPGGPALRFVTPKKGKVAAIIEDSRVPLLRERLHIEGDATSTAYDKTVADAVAAFQKTHGLPANGQLTAATVDAINGPRRDRDAEIIAVNLERLRWMPRNLGKTYVMVNIPEFRLRLIRDGKLYWSTRIVTGKPGMPTPIMSAEMKFITVNPTWNVPPSIIKNEYLPALQQDPNALARIGLKVEQNRDGTIRIYQPPGDRNALGRIRFNFPNKFLVYQHDTPDKNLFAHAKRAYSHGCMRVQDPLMYGEKLLSIVLPNEHYTQERLHKMFGGSEININFPNFIPVHLTYQTAFVDEDGKLQIFEDVYGRDAKMIAILKGTEHKVAEFPVERARTSSSAPVRMPVGSIGPNADYNRGPTFFDALFGNIGSINPPPQPVPRQKAARRGPNNNVR